MSLSLHNFEQVRDVLDYGAESHVRMGELYVALRERSDQDRVKIVLSYLGQQEDVRASVVRRFGKEGRDKVLNSWLQYAPSSNVESVLVDRNLPADMSVDEVIALAASFDDAMIGLYAESAREADDPQVREVFENLAEMERREKQRFVRDAEWAQDF